jgi:hypothetical protein
MLMVTETKATNTQLAGSSVCPDLLQQLSAFCGFRDRFGRVFATTTTAEQM